MINSAGTESDFENPEQQKNRQQANTNLNKHRNLFNNGEFCRLLYAIIFAIFGGYWVSVAMAYTDNRGLRSTHIDRSSSLDDLGFKIVNSIFDNKENKIAGNSNDIVLLSLFLFTLVYTIIFCRKNLLTIFKRFILFLGIIYSLRALFIIATVPPLPYDYKPDHACKYWNNVFSAPYEMVFHSRRTCYDYFFSGHTANMTLLALILTKYSINITITIMAWCIFLLNILFILYLQLHYTIDCIVAFVLTVLLWVIMDYEVQLGKGWLGWWERNDPNNNMDTFRQDQFPRRLSHERLKLLQKHNKDINPSIV